MYILYYTWSTDEAVGVRSSFIPFFNKEEKSLNSNGILTFFQLNFFQLYYFVYFIILFLFSIKVRNFYVHATSRLDHSCSLEFRQNKIKTNKIKNVKNSLNLWKQSQTSWNQSQILWHYAGYVAKKMKMFSIFTNIQIY